MLHCYHINAIDFWFGAMTAEQLLETALNGGNVVNGSSDGFTGGGHGWSNLASFCKQVADLTAKAEPAFKRLGWEGDVRKGEGGPYYFALPWEGKMTLGYIIKQDNNGESFVASPIPLPHLDSEALGKLVMD